MVGSALADDDVGLVVGVGRDADALALADGEVMQAAVRAENVSVRGAHDRARVLGNVGAEEVGHLHLADEADALAVLLVGRRQGGGAREAPEFGLGEMADGEAGVAELRLREQGEEIRLVLVGIGALEQGEIVRPARHALRVMPGGDGRKALGPGVGAEHAELHLAVAHHVGIRREAAPIAVEQVIHDQPAVIGHEVDHAKLDAEPVGDGAGVGDVLLPRAVADDLVLVDPVLHVRAHDVVTLLLEQQGGDGAVHSARHGDENPFTNRHEPSGREGREDCQTRRGRGRGEEG